jgi:hypothetical protein
MRNAKGCGVSPGESGSEAFVVLVVLVQSTL